MSLKIAAIREKGADERRVALVPDVAARIGRLGCDVALEAGAGVPSSYPDASYKDVRIEPDRKALLGSADVVLAIQPPATGDVQAMKPGAILISFVYGRNNPDLVKALRDGRITAFAMEQVPRISRAQAMDALSSQATLAGY